MSQPGVGSFLVAAERFADLCIAIGELDRQAKAVPGCERLEKPIYIESYFPPSDRSAESREGLECTDRIEGRGGEEPDWLKWWEATDAQIADPCVPCQSRVSIWRERHQLRKKIGGLKRALLAAYRAERAKKGAAA